MSEAVALLSAIAGVLTAFTGLVGAIVMLVKVSRRERSSSARSVLEQVAEAAEDGVVTIDELRRIAENRDE